MKQSKILHFPESYTKEKRKELVDFLARERLEQVFSGERFVYDEGTFKIDESAFKAYTEMLKVLAKYLKQGKCKTQVDDPTVAYDSHEVRIEWLTNPNEDILEIDAKELVSIIKPLVSKKAKADRIITIEPPNTWVFYIEVYQPIEGWDEHLKRIRENPFDL